MMRTRSIGILLASAAVMGGAVAIIAQGCGDSAVTIYDCNYPIPARTSHDGKADSCCEIDPCPDYCVNDPCPASCPVVDVPPRPCGDGGADAADDGEAGTLDRSDAGSGDAGSDTDGGDAGGSDAGDAGSADAGADASDGG